MIENPQAKHKKLLDDLYAGKITQKELQKECAYWYMDCFEEIYPKPFPSPPQELLNYRSSSFKEQNQLEKDGFFQSPVIKSYMETKDLIKNENYSKLWQLREFLKEIPDGDFLARQKYQEKIRDFETTNLF